MATYRLLNISGSYGSYTGVDAPTGSFHLSPLVGKQNPVVGNLNVRRLNDRGLYNRVLAGSAKMSEVGESGFSGSNPLSQPATSPSWTQAQIGLRYGFVLPAFSSSMHEANVLNCHPSSSVPLEVSPVPASGTLFYSKQSRLQHLTYAVTASSNLIILNSASFGRSPYPFDFGSGRSNYVAASGNFVYASASAPAEINIFVPDYGKIVDIKIWVELVNDIRAVLTSNLAPGVYPSASIYSTGISNCGISLRSPNVLSNANGRPLFNIPQLSTYKTGNAEQKKGIYWLNDILDSGCYPLWMPGGDPNWGNALGTLSASWLFYGSDMDMRTVFCDSAPVRSPYDATTAPLMLIGYDTSVTASIYNYYTLSGAMPNTYLSNNYGPINSLTSSFFGNWIPWFVDYRLKGGYLQSVNPSLFMLLASGSPPPGWLTGPGGSANTNEFPTSGSQLGPVSIRPIWPLLDDIFSTFQSPNDPNFQPDATISSNRLVGFRPGLRGTEIHGLWKVFLYNELSGIWFRQIRLEFVVDKGVENNPQTFSRKYFYQKKSKATRGVDAKLFANVSAESEDFNSQALGLGIETCFTIQPPQYGRSVGIIDNTGSYTDFAVFTRMTGALADILFASASLVSGTAGAIYSYLNNEFGTPFIPISSGSSIAPAFEAFKTDDLPTKSIISDIIRPRPILSQQHTLRATTSRLGLSRKMSDAITEKLTQLRKDSLL